MNVSVQNVSGPNSIGKSPARRSRQISFAGRYSVLLEICVTFVICFTVLRLAMLLWFSEPSELSIAEWGLVFLTGLRFDMLVTLCALFHS
ncbi:MAG: hypothetical protein WKF77_23145 [Planctomycetaceae bacterium]